MQAGQGPGSEEQLVQAARGGDCEAFGCLYDEHVQVVFRFCARRSTDPDQAEDLTSITFLEAWRCRDRMVLVDGSVRAWLLGVAKNVVRNQERARRRHQVALRR